MRKRVLGAIGILWGAAVLVSALARGGPRGEGAYLLGQVMALLFAVALIVVGWRAIARANDE